jgi:hypothetical protein
LTAVVVGRLWGVGVDKPKMACYFGHLSRSIDAANVVAA